MAQNLQAINIPGGMGLPSPGMLTTGGSNVPAQGLNRSGIRAGTSRDQQQQLQQGGNAPSMTGAKSAPLGLLDELIAVQNADGGNWISDLQLHGMAHPADQQQQGQHRQGHGKGSHLQGQMVEGHVFRAPKGPGGPGSSTLLFGRGADQDPYMQQQGEQLPPPRKMPGGYGPSDAGPGPRISHSQGRPQFFSAVDVQSGLPFPQLIGDPGPLYSAHMGSDTTALHYSRSEGTLGADDDMARSRRISEMNVSSGPIVDRVAAAEARASRQMKRKRQSEPVRATSGAWKQLAIATYSSSSSHQRCILALYTQR